MAYRRFLSVIERYYVSCDTGSLHTPCVNNMVIEGSGDLDIRHLECAITQASQANLGSRLLLKGHLALSRWVDSGKTAPLRIVEARDWDGHSEKNASFLHNPLPTRTGPTTEVVLVTGHKNKRHYLVFRSHHGVMDASGLQHFATDVFNILHGEAPVGENSRINDLQLAKSLKNHAKAAGLGNDVVAPTGFNSAMQANSPSRWIRQTLLGKYHDLPGKVALEIARFTRLNGEDNTRFHLPIDMRPRMINLHSTANLTGGIVVKVSADTGIEDWRTDINQQLNKNMEAEIPRFFRFVPFHLLNWIPRAIIKNANNKLIAKCQESCRFRSTAVISDKGLLPVASYSGAGFISEKVFFIPPELNTTALFVTLAGHPKGVEIIMRIPGFLDAEKMNQLLGFVIEGVKHSSAAEALSSFNG